MNKIKQLPTGWRWDVLDNVCALIFGQSPASTYYSTTPNGLPFFQGKADFGKNTVTPRVWCSKPIRVAEPGDILMSIRAPVGPTTVTNIQCCIGRGLCALRPKGDIMDRDFLLFYLKATEKELAAKGTGSTFHSIGKSALAAHSIAFPPLMKQKRIAELLNRQMAVVGGMRVAAEEKVAALRLLPSALLRQVFNHNKNLPPNWQCAKLGEVCEVAKGITPRREWYSAEGVRVVKFRDVKAGKLTWQPGVNSYVPKIYIPKLRELRFGMTLVGADAHNPEYIGKKVCIVREIPDTPAFFSGELMSFQSKDAGILADEWTFLWLSSGQGYDAMQEKVSGMHLNANPAKEILIPLPPLPEQRQKIDLFNRQMATIEKAQQAADELLSAINALPHALLRQTFAIE